VHRVFTPHARGSTRLASRFSRPGGVYPACAGIDLRKDVARRLYKGLPRMRGDRPFLEALASKLNQFTPHARGSTLESKRLAPTWRVYPACAGIDRRSGQKDVTFGGLPRMRGDRPHDLAECRTASLFTPHARGSTPSVALENLSEYVYPACAGIDLRRGTRRKRNRCLPRMRGDRPYYSYCEHCDELFTPHARGST